MPCGPVRGYGALMRHTWDDVADATDALMATVESLPEGAQFDPSLCRGWTRGHVLTHLARNAEGLGNLVTWAVTKVETPMYASAQARNDAIEAGSRRSVAALRDDIRNASTWLGLGARALSPARRLREVVYHHVDLQAGYAFADVPPDLVADFLGHEVARLRSDPAAPPMILRTAEGDEHVVGDIALAGDRTAYLSGSRAALLGWLARGLTDGVECQGGPLPELPKGS